MEWGCVKPKNYIDRGDSMKPRAFLLAGMLCLLFLGGCGEADSTDTLLVEEIRKPGQSAAPAPGALNTFPQGMPPVYPVRPNGGLYWVGDRLVDREGQLITTGRRETRVITDATTGQPAFLLKGDYTPGEAEEFALAENHLFSYYEGTNDTWSPKQVWGIDGSPLLDIGAYSKFYPVSFGPLLFSDSAVLDTVSGEVRYPGLLNLICTAEHALILTEDRGLTILDKALNEVFHGPDIVKIYGDASYPGYYFIWTDDSDEGILIDETGAAMDGTEEDQLLQGYFLIQREPQGKTVVGNLVTGVTYSFDHLYESVWCLEDCLFTMDAGGVWKLADYSGTEILAGTGQDMTFQGWRWDFVTKKTYLKMTKGDDNYLLTQAGEQFLHWKTRATQSGDPIILESVERLIWSYRDEEMKYHGSLLDFSGRCMVPEDAYYSITCEADQAGVVTFLAGYLQNGSEKRCFLDVDGKVLVEDIDGVYAFDGERAVIRRGDEVSMIDMAGNVLAI